MRRAARNLMVAALLAALGAARPALAAPPDLLIEAELTPARVYVGGEARLRLRLYRAPGITHGALRAPALGEAADMSVLGPIHSYQVRRDGIAYDVIERIHVIVPRRAGRLVVPGAEFEGALRSAEILDRDTVRPASAPRTARGPQTVLEVRPLPAGAGEPWLPARRLTIEESWSRDLDALSAGTPVTRTLIVRAEGIAAERLPRLEMAAHPALLVHHDQPETATEFLAEGMASRRVQRIALMPLAGAEVALPAITVRWWDTEADAPRSATLAARTLRLHAAIAPVAVPREAPAPAAAPAWLRWLPVALLALFAAAIWWHVATLAQRETRRQLRDACRRNDARAARDALLAWGKAVRPRAPPRLLQQLGAGWPDADARAELAALDAALYAGRDWDGASCWRCLQPWLRKPLRLPSLRRAASASSLPPLFRLRERR